MHLNKVLLNLCAFLSTETSERTVQSRRPAGFSLQNHKCLFFLYFFFQAEACCSSVLSASTNTPLGHYTVFFWWRHYTVTVRVKLSYTHTTLFFFERNCLTLLGFCPRALHTFQFGPSSGAVRSFGSFLIFILFFSRFIKNICRKFFFAKMSSCRQFIRRKVGTAG